MQGKTPERIYNWEDSMLSIARFYGGCTYNGADYVIAPDEEGQPLVRVDVLRKAKRNVPADAAQLPLQPNA